MCAFEGRSNADPSMLTTPFGPMRPQTRRRRTPTLRNLKPLATTWPAGCSGYGPEWSLGGEDRRFESATNLPPLGADKWSCVLTVPLRAVSSLRATESSLDVTLARSWPEDFGLFA